MKVLVACEYSGRVRDAFINKGHDAVSCDLLPSESDKGKHYQDDLMNHLNESWEMMIAFPPCTHLAVSGAAWFYRKQKEQSEALTFVKTLLNAPIPKIALENPVGVISTKIRKPDQIIQPYQFGESFSKKTCLWLKNLPLLVPTKIVGKGEFVTFASGKKMPKWYADSWGKGHERGRTFQGIANAMAEQWS